MLPILLARLLLRARGRRTPPRRRSAARPPRQSRGRKRINLALQGGGAQGAFTWGALDQLLEHGGFDIDGISGASAGAMNAIMLADGLNRGGTEQARERLADFWRAVSVDGHLPGLQRHIVERLFRLVPQQAVLLGTLSQVLSPYDLNPLNINPLKDLIERFVDFEAIRGDRSRELFIAATNVHTGEQRIFGRPEITAETVMASACLPLLFRAVKIEGVPYWDGGFTGNPPIIPFLSATATEDVLLIQINPRERRMLPTSSREIINRLNEISFNAPLLSELRGISLVNRLLDEGRLPRGMRNGEFRRLRLHRIVMDDSGESFAARSTLKRDYEHFSSLHELGRRAARRFLDTRWDDIGRRSTIDLVEDVQAELLE